MSRFEIFDAYAVTQTIEQAMKRWHLKAETIFHNNRGSQYTSDAAMSLLKKHGIKQSFFASMKKEQVHWRHFKTIDEARKIIFEYIEVFYNKQRV